MSNLLLETIRCLGSVVEVVTTMQAGAHWLEPDRQTSNRKNHSRAMHGSAFFIMKPTLRTSKLCKIYG